MVKIQAAFYHLFSSMIVRLFILNAFLFFDISSIAYVESSDILGDTNMDDSNRKTWKRLHGKLTKGSLQRSRKRLVKK